MSRIPALKLVFFIAVLCLLHSAGNHILPLIDRDEPRFAEATREMIQRQDWVIPYFNNEYRFDKPPLIYWMQAGAVAVFGEGEFAMRFPSVLCAALVSALLVVWGAQWRGAATGWRAGIIFALCLQVFMHGRSSVADMPMVLAAAAATWCAWRAGEGSRAAAWAFWFWLGVGFLAKGPVAWLPLLALPWAGQKVRAALFRPWWRWVGGAALMLGLVAAWGVPALVLTKGEFYRIGIGKHVVDRSVGVMEGHGAKGLGGYAATLPLYFATIWLSLFPWCIWLPRTVRQWWREGRQDPLPRFLGALAVIIFVVFTLVRTKLPHYILPAFPMLALLIAGWWPAPARKPDAEDSAHAPEPETLRDALRGTFGKVCAAWLVFAVAAPFTLFAWVASHSPTEMLWEKVGSRITDETQFATTDFQEPSLVWTMRRKTRGYMDVISAKKAAAWIAKPGSRLLLCEKQTYEKQFSTPPQGVEVFSISGFQIARWRPAELVALLKVK